MTGPATPLFLSLLEISGSIISGEENKLVPAHSGKDLSLPGQHQRKPHIERAHTPHTAIKNHACIPLTHTWYNQVAARELRASSGDCLWGIHVGWVVWRLAGRVGCG